MAEKKEIWKLIELLNEFYKEKWDIFRAIQHNDRLKVFELENDDLVRDAAIISKEYWFIKWLVENDKIDYHNKINYDISLAINRVPKKTTREERLLMMLAIQDEPIEFLISILK